MCRQNDYTTVTVETIFGTLIFPFDLAAVSVEIDIIDFGETSRGVDKRLKFQTGPARE